MKLLFILILLQYNMLYALNFEIEVIKELSSKEYLEHLKFIDKEIENLKIKEKIKNKEKANKIIKKLHNLECMNENVSLCKIANSKSELLLSKNKDKYINILKSINYNKFDETYSEKQTIYAKYFKDYNIKFSHKNFKPFYLNNNKHIKLYISDKQLTIDNKNIFIADLKYFIKKYSKNIKIVNNINNANYTLDLYKGNSSKNKQVEHNNYQYAGQLLFGTGRGYLLGKGVESIMNNYFGTNVLNVDYDIVLKDLSKKCKNQNIENECVIPSSNKLTIKYKTKKMDNIDSFVFSSILTSIIANSTIRSFR